MAEAKPIIVEIEGKVAAVQAGQSVIYSVVTLAAESQFDTPPSLKIRSLQPLGKVGDVVKVRCQLTGYGRSYNTTNAVTGQKERRKTADNILDAVA